MSQTKTADKRWARLLGKMALRSSVAFLISALFASLVAWDYTISRHGLTFDAEALNTQCVASVAVGDIQLKVEGYIDLHVSTETERVTLFGKEYSR